MPRLMRWLTAGLSLGLVLALSGAGPAAQAPAGQPQARFRGAVDLIAVDVQVVDRDGRPVADLKPGSFAVTVDGRRRRVVSADYIDEAQPVASTTTEAPQPAAADRETLPSLGRVMMLAVDCLSFDNEVTRGVMEAARDFLARLPPNDQIGLYAYPIGPKVDPTTDRAAVIKALDSVVGQRGGNPSNQFRLRPSEVVDMTAAMANNLGDSVPPALFEMQLRECPGDTPGVVDELCAMQLTTEIKSSALYYEAQANVSLGMLRALLGGMADVAGRKTLVLLSAGMPASDAPGGRPDLGEVGTLVGKEAARANTAIYTLQVDAAYLQRFAAETRRAPSQIVNLERDTMILGRWLEQFSGASGGALFKVLSGRGEAAFTRILSETSSYYLLGVETAESDRDGRAHDIKVRVDRRNVTVRSRTWVAVPKPGTAPALAPVARSAVVAGTAAALATPRTPLPPDVRSLADAYERQDYATVERTLKQVDLPSVARSLRTADSAWPDSPRRAAALSLEVALAAIQSDNGYARDEGVRLLSQAQVLVKQAEPADQFECLWHWTSLVGLEGLTRPDVALLFVPRALERCPDQPRFHLAHAVITDQGWLRGRVRTVGGQRVVGPPTPREVVELGRLYEKAMTYPETASEARIRKAWLTYRTGTAEEALDIVAAIRDVPADPIVRYLGELVRGQSFRKLGRFDEAEAAYRAALAAWPGAQSARVALMSVVGRRGNREEAAALAEAVGQAPDDQFDPWWMYWLGDYLAFPELRAALRAEAK